MARLTGEVTRTSDQLRLFADVCSRAASGGRCSRWRVVPFYGELGSINPVFVTGAATDRRGEAIASQYFASYTLGSGQFCTKVAVTWS